LMFGI